jgi:hypothetical protein
MTVSARDYAAVYSGFQAPISKIYNCGAKCAPFNGGTPVCCDAGNAIPIVEKSEYTLLKQRTKMWSPFVPRTPDQKAEIADLKGSDSCAVECRGAEHCERDNRSLACRSFPFFPYFDTDKNLVGLAHYWNFEGICWVIHNLTIVEKPFIDQFIAQHEFIFKKDDNWRVTYVEHSAVMRGVYSRRGDKFPIIMRDGTYRWVLPKSGGKMVRATKKDLLSLRKGFTLPDNPLDNGAEAAKS